MSATAHHTDPAPARRLPLGRTGQTLALGLVLVLLAGALRSSDESGMDRDRFWINKIRWQGVADVVIAGDSRSYIGLAPAHLAPYLGNVRVHNFGFDAVGFYGQYIDAAERVLDPRSPAPRFILCVTPRALTPGAEGFNGFRAFVSEVKSGPGWNCGSRSSSRSSSPWTLATSATASSRSSRRSTSTASTTPTAGWPRTVFRPRLGSTWTSTGPTCSSRTRSPRTS